MARELTEHRVNGTNDTLRIVVGDEPGAGGACHRYTIDGFDARSNPSTMESPAFVACHVLFQNGPIKEAGVNGVTQEALLAIVADRLRCFQSGPYACKENAAALEHVERAMDLLFARTKARQARGVEGTHAL